MALVAVVSDGKGCRTTHAKWCNQCVTSMSVTLSHQIGSCIHLLCAFNSRYKRQKLEETVRKKNGPLSSLLVESTSRT
jgi:hypothetical protein